MKLKLFNSFRLRVVMLVAMLCPAYIGNGMGFLAIGPRVF